MIDEDKGNNVKIFYSFFFFVNLLSDDFFVDFVSGVIRVVKKFDREIVVMYNLKVVVIDGGIFVKLFIVGVRIIIGDINDNSLKFFSKEIEIRVFEKTLVGFVLMKISVFDLDEGVNVEVEYEKIDGLDSDKFDFSYTIGESVIFKNRVDFDYEEG